MELAEIYQQRGVEPVLSLKVAEQLMSFDALGTHSRDEIGISQTTQAKPIVVVLALACSFSVGALLPLLTAYFNSEPNLVFIVAAFSLVFLALLGAVSASLSGAKI
jgi:VIT1/CCC1 family predicted Fe2+/Mn2+ transporter